MNARFNYYPPCPWPEKVFGAKAHADSSAITVLLQDKEVEGLQLFKDDQWFRVPIVQDALTINVGDQMEIISNGIFKSPMHRVCVNSKKERMTLAMFCMPQTEKVIGPVDGLITEETPRLYKNVTYTLDFFFQNYQQGLDTNPQMLGMENYESMNMQLQEIASEFDQLPPIYVRKEYKDFSGIGLSHVASVDVPVIDFSLLTSSPLELDKLRSAVSTWGCFQAINHGIEGSFLEKVREISRLFFRSSMEDKKKCLRAKDDLEGYGNDVILLDQQTLDWVDRLYITVRPKHQQKLQFWPQNPTHFREVLDEYSSKIEMINKVVLKALARSLHLEDDCFLNQYGTTAKMHARFNYYPPCRWADNVFGLKPHADRTAITVLLQDKEIEGLQLLKDGHWVGVPIIRDALTINVGDQIEIMSNGVFKSRVHRALVNPKYERMTLAMFCMPQTEKGIGPVDELITDETPRLYKNVKYSLDFYFEHYQQGKRPIDACKV